MIDWEQSAELNNMDINELKLYFDKYPSSNKRIIAICDNYECREERNIIFYSYRDFCLSCSMKGNQKCIDAANDRWNEPGAREEMSQIKNDYWNNNDVAKDKAREIAIEQWSDQKARDIQSETLKHSDSQKEQHDKQRGGNDIVKHHYIYDHNDLSKYTMKMTRSKHTYIHWLMWKSDIKVPHINKGGD